MEKIVKNIRVPITNSLAFRKFVQELGEWWPSEYTWSQNKLNKIFIEPKKDGFCTEVGPFGFRCDWGRVIEIIEGKKIRLKWQISVNREPVPDPDKASEISVLFMDEGASTKIKFKHSKFENHGEGADQYRKMLDTEQGWDYILDRYVKYCEPNH